MKKFIFIIVISCFGTFLKGQSDKYLDSLTKHCADLKSQNSSLFPHSAHLLYGEIKKYDLPKRKVNVENLLGIYYTINQKFDSGFVYFSSALNTAIILKDTLMKINMTMNIGIVLRYQKNYPKSQEYFLAALEQGEAHKYIQVQINGLYNLSGLYLDWGKHKEAIEANRKGYQLAIEANDVQHQVKSLEGIGSNYSEMNQTDSAKHYLLLAYEKAKLIDYSDELSYLCNNIGGLYLQLKDYKAAESFLLQAKKKALEMNYKNSLVDIYSNLKALYMETKDYEKSLFYSSKTDSLKTSIYNEDILNTTTEMEAKYQSEKKEIELKQASKELLVQEEKNRQKTIIIWLSFAVIVGAGFFAALAFINFRKAKRAGIIVQNQNKVLALKNKEVETQKILIELKQKEIIDSINYAQKIQSAVLTGEEVWKKISNEYFIIFQPKDIVSGDFYWAFNTMNNRSVIVLADCTGHGVPGGFMSMLGNSLLNEIVVENKIFKPDQILNKLRQKIISSLGQKGSADRRDGMDMAVCTWNKLDNSLEFAGANNRLWIIRNGSLAEYSGDKMPVGNFEGIANPFNCHAFQLEKNDLIVMSTDGFSDQFGGDGGKKFMSKNLKNLILNNSDLPLDAQKRELVNAFNSWKGDQDQVDDISLIMIKVV